MIYQANDVKTSLEWYVPFLSFFLSLADFEARFLRYLFPAWYFSQNDKVAFGFEGHSWDSLQYGSSVAAAASTGSWLSGADMVVGHRTSSSTELSSHKYHRNNWYIPSPAVSDPRSQNQQRWNDCQITQGRNEHRSHELLPWQLRSNIPNLQQN